MKARPFYIYIYINIYIYIYKYIYIYILLIVEVPTPPAVVGRLCDNNKFKNISFGIGERQFLSKQMLRNDAPPPGTYGMYTTLEATPFNQSIML